MNLRGKVVLLVGSAKRPRSTSESLGTYLVERLRERGFSTEMKLIYRSLASDDGRKALLAASDGADILVLAFPLYVDSLPALVIKTLELLAKQRLAQGGPRKQRLLAIVNCGFPEAHHNTTALAICRCFAQEAGFEWVGGLALGGGEAIDGQPLAKVKTLARNAIRSLDLAAEAIAAGEPLPQKAVRLMAKPLVPTWMYTWLGERIWRKRARKKGAIDKLDARPYQQEEEVSPLEVGVTPSHSRHDLR